MYNTKQRALSCIMYRLNELSGEKASWKHYFTVDLTC